MSESLAITKFSDLANPTFFLALAGRILPWMGGITALLFAAGLYMSFTTDGDYQQGQTVRIMYIHVPAAWLSMMCYTVMAMRRSEPWSGVIPWPMSLTSPQPRLAPLSR